MKRAFPRKALLIVLSVSLIFGVAQLYVGSALMGKAEAFFRVDEDRQLLSLARGYSRKLISRATNGVEQKQLLAESSFIAQRGAFIAAYSRYRDELSRRWVLASSLIVAVLAAAALLGVSMIVRSLERAGMRNEAIRARAQWQTTGRILAHEIKNALSPLSIDLEFLLSDWRDDSAGAKCYGRMQKNVKRITTMVNSFRQFSELPEPVFCLVDLGQVVENAATQAGLSDLLDTRQIRILGKRKVYTDPEYLSIVILNCLKNAKEAGASSTLAQWSKGALILLDNGPGLPPEIADILKREGPRPGLSTKEGGSGMGLYIIFELCKILGIDVALRNKQPGLETKLEFKHG